MPGHHRVSNPGGMTYPTAEFLAELGRREHEKRLENIRGTIRMDVVRNGETEYWHLSIAAGRLRVSHDAGPADLVMRAEQACWDGLVRGEIKPLGAWLRNELAVEGRFELIMVLERLLPATPGAHDPRDLVREGSRPA